MLQETIVNRWASLDTVQQGIAQGTIYGIAQGIESCPLNLHFPEILSRVPYDATTTSHFDEYSMQTRIYRSIVCPCVTPFDLVYPY